MWAVLCGGLLPIIAVTGQVALEQHARELAVREGDGVTFQCNMSGGSMSNYYMLWYRKGSRGTLEWIYNQDGSYGEGFRDRFTGSLQSFQNRFTLQIRAAKPEDEAVYYCAARNLGRTLLGVHWRFEDELMFGGGTTLTVEPDSTKSSDPEVIVMKSKKLNEDGSTGKAACLARNFNTKNIILNMPSDDIVYQQKTPILTSKWSYNTIKVVKVTNKTEVTCVAKSDNNIIGNDTARPEKESEEPVRGEVCNITDTPAQDTKVEKANMLSMAVLGLRILLAKSIAFNTLMSIKLFLF